MKTNPHLKALHELEYPEKLQKLLLTPNRELGVELVVQMDNGEIEVLQAYRVQVRRGRETIWERMSSQHIMTHSPTLSVRRPPPPPFLLPTSCA